ncbi:histidine kinase [Novosphingobium sp. PC22D]|nr:PAS domain S-box protein [Novosphingobium sp. PC22D]PEQ13727.1 histidine kinase [Novosphingobium sp. PC22D]
MPATGAAAFLAAIVESTDDAIVGKSLEGVILSWNAAAERIFGYTAEEMTGRNVRSLIPEDRQEEEDRIISTIMRGERVPTFETVRRRKDGSEVQVAITVSPVRDEDGNVVAASKIARDITEQKRIRSRLAESEQRFRLMADNISQLAWIADGDGWIFWYNKRWFDYTGTTHEQMQGWGWKAVHHPEHVDRVVERIQHSWDTGEDWEDTFPLRGADGNYRWFLSRAVPIRDEAGVVRLWFGTNTDVTEMRDAEQRIELLLQEVNHRSKNMLAVIRSLARRSDANSRDFLERFDQRIAAIAANQDLLVSRAWSQVPLREMLETQLQFLADAQAQCELAGPIVELSPAAAEALAMAVHEMATNALKYGALSIPEGRVRIVWTVSGDGSSQDRRFAISWRESGGPAVAPPQGAGFGTRVIVDVPRHKLAAQVKADYPPEGFAWTLECPLEAP